MDSDRSEDKSGKSFQKKWSKLIGFVRSVSSSAANAEISATLENATPELCVHFLQYPSVKNYQGLCRRISSADGEWIEQFLEQGGLVLLFESFDQLTGKISDVSDASTALYCQSCIHAVINHSSGMKYLASSKELVEKLVEMLESTNAGARKQAYEFLAAVAHVSEAGHASTLRALKSSSGKPGGKIRTWATLVAKELKQPKSKEWRSAVMSLVNCLIVDAKDYSSRCRIRQEFLLSGLNEQLLQQMEAVAIEEEDHNLTVQLELFRKFDAEDKAAWDVSGDKVFDPSDPLDLLEGIIIKTKNTPAEPKVIGILQNLALQDTKLDSCEQIWNMIDTFTEKAAALILTPYKIQLLEGKVSRLIDRMVDKRLRSRYNKKTTEENQSNEQSSDLTKQVKDEESTSTISTEPPPRGTPTTQESADLIQPPPPPPPLPQGFFQRPRPKTPSAIPVPPPLPQGSSTIPVPPPPPPPLAQGFKEPSKALVGQTEDKIYPKRKSTKSIQWHKIDSGVIKGRVSVWKRNQENYFGEDDLDRIENLFARTAPSSTLCRSLSAPPRFDKSVKEETAIVSLFEHKRSMPIAIALSQFKTKDPTKIVEAVVNGDQTLKAESLRLILSEYPSKEEIETVTAFDGNKDRLGFVEKFVLSVGQESHFRFWLELLILQQEFRNWKLEVQEKMDLVKRGCEELRGSCLFATFLHICLSLGNYLNQGTHQGGAAGFNLVSLEGVLDAKSKEPQILAVHVIAEKHLALEKLGQELMSVRETLRQKINLEELETDIRKHGLTVIKLVVTQEKDLPFRNSEKQFLQETSQYCQALEEDCKQIRKHEATLREFFHADDLRLEEIFGIVDCSVKKMETAFKENAEKAKLEARKAKMKSAQPKTEGSKATVLTEDEMCSADRLLANIRSGNVSLRATSGSLQEKELARKRSLFMSHKSQSFPAE